MTHKYSWKKHPTKKDHAIGICKSLPDSHCQCFIQKLEDSNYWIALPSMLEDTNTRKLIIRDKETARDFANDFLNYNIKTIIHFQIKQMKAVYNLKTEKPISYYEAVLQKIIEEEIKKSKK